MNRLTTPALALLGCTLACTPSALGQNLSERINYVMQQRAQAEARNSTKASMLGVLLYRDLSNIQFQETPARDVFRYLQQVLGINIVGRYSDDRTGFGIDPETPITLEVSNKPALTVLEMVLGQCSAGGLEEQCTWQLRNGFVEVGTKERLNSATELRYYPIRDLLFEPPRFDNAPELDLDAALNQGGGGGQGGQGGGGGGGGGLGGGGGGGRGGGGGGGGGGGIFGDPGEEGPRANEIELAQEVMNIITETVEPEAWDIAGGDAATIRYYQGTLIVRAPDYIHRQLSGYPFATRPTGTNYQASTPRRYVTFTGSFSTVANAGFRETDAKEFGGSVGGR